MTISFNYKSVKRPDGTLVRIPSIPVTFFGKENFDSIALVDSGADISIIPKDIAEILGLKIDEKKIDKVYGIGGTVRAIESNVNINIQKGHENYNFNLPIKVVLDNYDFPIILGRIGFFDKFIISFNQKREKILLKKIS